MFQTFYNRDWYCFQVQASHISATQIIVHLMGCQLLFTCELQVLLEAGRDWFKNSLNTKQNNINNKDAFSCINGNLSAASYNYFPYITITISLLSTVTRWGLVIVLKTRKKRCNKPYNNQLDLFQDTSKPIALISFYLCLLRILVTSCSILFMVLSSLVRVCRPCKIFHNSRSD